MDIVEIILVPQGSYDIETLPPEGVVVSSIQRVIRLVENPQQVIAEVVNFMQSIHGIVIHSNTIPTNIVFASCNCDPLAGDFKNVSGPAIEISQFIDMIIAHDQ